MKRSLSRGAERSVLLIDDDADLLRLYSLILEKHEYRVHTAYDGSSGLALACRLCPDLILLDLDMPPPDGWEVIRRLRAEPALAAVPVAAFTAHLLGPKRQQALWRAGFDHYLPKQQGAAALVAAVRRIISRPPTQSVDDAPQGD